ncbi:MAG: hypothetical protein LUQ04_01325, partial [Methanoregula sp.]|nr:hypothetical protein [Methanoregula sp.]
GEGYGVSLYAGTALIEANLFDYNRHSITGSGVKGESYEARYNHVLGHGNAIGASHFDVHAGGNAYKIHHNTFETVFTSGAVYAIGIQSGVPGSGLWIDHNIIEWDDKWSNRPVFMPTATKSYISQNMVGIPPTLKTSASGVVMYKSG